MVASTPVSSVSTCQLNAREAKIEAPQFLGSPSKAPKVAVLPFFALSREPQHELLGDALAQELILELSRLHWLFVVARGSAFMFRALDLDVAKIGAILGTSYVLSGAHKVAGMNREQRQLQVDRKELVKVEAIDTVVISASIVSS